MRSWDAFIALCAKHGIRLMDRVHACLRAGGIPDFRFI